MHRLGIISDLDRAALAAYCQAYGRWVEAERKLKETPPLIKLPSGIIQQSPWLTISNK
jgi:P27 family predicted phage terminase small subunit